MRRLIVAVGGVMILAAVNLNVYRKEQLLGSGQVVLLELAPADPRSLMQGDYMALRFRVADDAFRGVPAESLADGRLVVTVDDRRVGRFARFDTGAPISPQEILLRYRVRNQMPKFGTNAFFFQEGHAGFYEGARYGEFRVSPSGEAILTALRGETLLVLGPR